MTTKLEWKKLPSVTREGKWFYRAQSKAGHWITVQQSWLTGLWGVNHNGADMDGQFATSKEAMNAASAMP